MIDLRVISIGCLGAHPLWNERQPVRTAHATTSLIRSGDNVILVDPGLPAPIIKARLAERAGLTPEDVTHVFLTRFAPDTTRGITAFESAQWWIAEAEREQIGGALVRALQQAIEEDEQELVESLRSDVAALQRCKNAPDKLAPGVDLFPLPGVSPGLCGVLIAEPSRTSLICGDAIATIEHLEKGMVLKSAMHVEQAKESLMEAIEIADQLVLGRDNIVPSAFHRPF